MHTWIRPHDPSGMNNGINDGSIYTFKERKYESLAREILQNSIDERLDQNQPVVVEFSLFHYPVKDLPEVVHYKKLYQDSLHYWQDNHQENAKDFFTHALALLEKETIPILRISDFNTKGVKGSSVTTINSSKDISPWYNLLKSEGSSSKGATQGGSFGIGKNATFATSSLRTVFYSTWDEEGTKAHEGIAKLASIFKEQKAYAAKAFYGDVYHEKSTAIPSLLSLDPSFRRADYGTDIYIFGFETEEDWTLRMVLSILSDFFLPIHEDHLKVSLNGESICSATLPEIYDKYMLEAEKGALTSTQRQELAYARNYYEVATSEKTLTFYKDFSPLGQAKLRVLYDPDFDRKVMRTRKTGMKLFSHGHISSSIGFSGIVSLEGEELNKSFRKMENPAHTAWSPDHVDTPKEKSASKKLLQEFNKWIKEVILDNAYDKTLETQEVEGLGAYLPSIQKEAPGAEEKEILSAQVKDIRKYEKSKEELKKLRYESLKETLGKSFQEGDEGAVFSGQKDKSQQKGGQGAPHSGGTAEGTATTLKKMPGKLYSSRLVKTENHLLLFLTPKKNLEKAMLFLSVSREIGNSPLEIQEAVHLHKGKVYALDKNHITLGDLPAHEQVPVKIVLKEPGTYALEVILYERQSQ